MKKIFALVMVVTVLGAFLAGCGKSEEPAATDTTGTTATAGTAAYLARFDQPVDLVVGKVSEGAELTAVDLIADGKISFVINTPQGRGGRTDGEQIRKSANSNRVSSVTTNPGATAFTRTPRRPKSTANERVNPVIAALAAA